MAATPSANTSQADVRRQLLVGWKAGQVIFQEGQRGNEMFIIEAGRVDIVRKRGGEERTLVELEAGDFFGEMSLLEDLPRSATARARTDCRLLPVDPSTFDLMLRDHPEVAIRIMRMLSRRLRQFDEAEQRAHAIAAGALMGVSQSNLVPAAVAAQAASVLPGSDPVPPRLVAPPAVAAAAPAQPARLVHAASGREFALAAAAEQVVGRLDPVTGLVPEIDLTEVDNHRSLSRRHARIIGRDGRYFVREEIGTANGTFVGAARLTTGKEHQLADGDTLRFGLVELRFHQASAPPPPTSGGAPAGGGGGLPGRGA